MNSNKRTSFLSKEEAIKSRKWIEIDATGKTLGRLASKVAVYLRGKHKPNFTPHVDCGDFVIVTNVDKIRVTGKKMTDKYYYSYSGYIGGLKEEKLCDLIARDPCKVFRLAVKGMLPRNKMRKRYLKKLRIFAGSRHNHGSQQPQRVEM